MTALTTTSLAATAPATRRLPGPVHYTLSALRLTTRNPGYLIFTIGLPVAMYLVFNGIWGGEQVVPGVNYSALLMVQMAAYGSLGAALSGGAIIAVERRSGWFRQLMLTPIPARSFLLARALVVLVIVLPSLLLVFGTGLILGVRAPVGTWFASLGLMWLSLLPLTALGMVIGLVVKNEAVQGLNTVVLLVLSLAGGLWFPIQLMPAAMQTIAKFLPSYWIGEFGRWPFLDDPFPWVGVLVLAGWALAGVGLGALGYRRAARDSKR